MKKPIMLKSLEDKRIGMLKSLKENKTGGIVTNTVMGVGALVIGVIVILVVVDTLQDANLLGAGTKNDTATGLASNFSIGISKVSGKIPTILLIVAVVFLLGALVLLMKQARGMGIGGDSGSL